MAYQPQPRITEYVYINSVIDRLTTDDLHSNEFTCLLARPITNNASSPNKYFEISIKNLEMPNSAYSFGIQDSVFYFEIVPAGTTFNNGIPSNTPILTWINIDTNRIFVSGGDLCNALNSSLTTYGHSDFNFSYNGNTGHLTFNNTGSSYVRIIGSYRYSDLSTQCPNNACDKLGFTQNMTSPTVQWINPGSSLTALGLVNLIRTNCYYLLCNNIDSGCENKNNIPSPYLNNGNSRNILTRVASQNFGNLSQFSLMNMQQFKITQNSINYLTFSILDDQFYPIDLNFMPITMLVEIIHYY